MHLVICNVCSHANIYSYDNVSLGEIKSELTLAR